MLRDDTLPIGRLALLTLAAVALHGYHLGIEDAEIYIPAARKLLHPDLYPYASEFFASHEHLSLFGSILAWIARLTHLSMDWTIFFCYIASFFAMLVACWMLAAACFTSPRARWCSLLVMTAVLTMPATNTGLRLMDPYLTARSFSTPLTLAALVWLVRRRYALAVPAILVTGGVHPQMATYLIVMAVMLWVAERVAPAVPRRVPVAASVSMALPLGLHLGLAPAQAAYREALYSRDYYFLYNWTWYHWLGMIAPLAFLAWFWKTRLPGTTPESRTLSISLVPFGLLSILAAAIISSSHRLDMFARLQPLRCFHLITLVFVILLAGVIGEFVAAGRRWVVPALVLPLACGMFLADWQTAPNSPHIDWPWQKNTCSPWINALLWIRDNTPRDAVFAVDSRYFRDKGVDEQGFRALSQRASLADYFKDGGVVTIFPDLAVEWKQMSTATYGLNHFRREDFERLAQLYPVTWTIIHGPAPEGMACPYQRDQYVVCRIAAPLERDHISEIRRDRLPIWAGSPPLHLQATPGTAISMTHSSN